MRGKALAALALAALLSPWPPCLRPRPSSASGRRRRSPPLPGVVTHRHRRRRRDRGDRRATTTSDGGKGKRPHLRPRRQRRALRRPGARPHLRRRPATTTSSGEGGLRNLLIGGPGDDDLIAYGDGDSVVRQRGGRLHLHLQRRRHRAFAAGPGDDDIRTGDWTKLDAGDGTTTAPCRRASSPSTARRCACLCGGTGAPLPDLGSLAGLTSAPGDFDGDGDADTLYVWHDRWTAGSSTSNWTTATGSSTSWASPAENLGGTRRLRHQRRRHRRDLRPGRLLPPPASWASAPSDPHRGPPTPARWRASEFGAAPRRCFAIGRAPTATRRARQRPGLPRAATTPSASSSRSPGPRRHLACSSRYDTTYEPSFGIDNPQLGADSADAPRLLDPADPGDDAVIQRAREFHCPGHGPSLMPGRAACRDGPE